MKRYASCCNLDWAGMLTPTLQYAQCMHSDAAMLLFPEAHIIFAFAVKLSVAIWLLCRSYIWGEWRV